MRFLDLTRGVASRALPPPPAPAKQSGQHLGGVANLGPPSDSAANYGDELALSDENGVTPAVCQGRDGSGVFANEG